MSVDNDIMNSSGVHDDVIAACVNKAAMAVDGVYEMGRELSAAALTKNLLKQDKTTRGVRLTHDEDAGYTIDIYLIVKYGVNIPETAWNVQKKVADELKSKLNIEPVDINIHVQGVYAK